MYKKILGIVAILFIILLAREFFPYLLEPTPVVIDDELQIEKVAEDLGKPTCLEWIDSEWLLICDAESGNILSLHLTSEGFSTPSSILTGLSNPHGVLVWTNHNNGSEHLIVSQAGKLESWTITNGEDPTEWVLSGKKTLVSGVPTGNHQQNAIMLGVDGNLIWHSGSTCNVCDENDERNAALLSVNPITGEHDVIASGVRNSFDGTWVPDIGYIFTDNGHDWDGDDYPVEEVNLLKIGSNYGWPNSTENTPIPFGSLPPIGEYIPHSSVNGIDTRPSTSTLPGGNHTVYATVFGSWNTIVPVGKEVIRIDIVEDTSNPQGWSCETTVVVKDLATPLALRFHPYGDLYFAEYAHGTLYRVSSSQP